MKDINEESYGVKVSVISTLDYIDFREILDAIAKLGYKITMIDNGNAVCEKQYVDFFEEPK